jgi:hypothetical protein
MLNYAGECVRGNGWKEHTLLFFRVSSADGTYNKSRRRLIGHTRGRCWRITVSAAVTVMHCAMILHALEMCGIVLRAPKIRPRFGRWIGRVLHLNDTCTFYASSLRRIGDSIRIRNVDGNKTETFWIRVWLLQVMLSIGIETERVCLKIQGDSALSSAVF